MQEGEDEAHTYDKLACFCKDTTAEKQASISKASGEKESHARGRGRGSHLRQTCMLLQRHNGGKTSLHFKGIRGKRKSCKRARTRLTLTTNLHASAKTQRRKNKPPFQRHPGKKKVMQEGEDEAHTYDKLACFCKDTTAG